MPSVLPISSRRVDTVVVGNGPSALILSYILHGHIPRYVGQHPDANLHHALVRNQDLLSFDAHIYDHLRSSLKYSAQALPVNVLLDTLLRPDGDVSDYCSSCVQWTYEATRAVEHVVLGDSSKAGGQWADNPTVASWNIGTLSYAEQLSLPGYTFADHWQRTRGTALPELVRPSRTDVSEYFARYPEAVGIADSIEISEHVDGIARSKDGFDITSHGISCRHLVLATGTFSISLPPPRSLASLTSLHDDTEPMLVIGSGFTAADIIVSTPPSREILHIFNWDPQNKPSPLKGCHSQAYPEYAWIYRQMKLAATGSHRSSKTKHKSPRPVKAREMSSLPSFSQRDWSETYHGFPNAKATAMADIATNNFDGSSSPNGALGQTSRVAIHTPTHPAPAIHSVGALHYAAGRRGNLSYLSPSLLSEVLDAPDTGETPFESSSLPTLTRLASHASTTAPDVDPWTGESDTAPPSPTSTSHSRTASGSVTPAQQPAVGTTVSGQAFRARIEETNSMEVASNVHVIGSLTGDSLVRFALGGCCVVAGQILGAAQIRDSSIFNGLSYGLPTPSNSQDVNRKEHLPHRVTSSRALATQHLSHDGAKADFHSQEHQRKAFPLDRRKGKTAVVEQSGWSCCVQ